MITFALTHLWRLLCHYLRNQNYMYIKLATVVEGDPKSPFLIGVGEGAIPFPGFLHFTLDPYLIMLSVKQGSIKYHFLSLWYASTWDWTQISWAIVEYSNHYANVHIIHISFYSLEMFCTNFNGWFFSEVYISSRLLNYPKFF